MVVIRPLIAYISPITHTHTHTHTYTHRRKPIQANHKPLNMIGDSGVRTRTLPPSNRFPVFHSTQKSFIFRFLSPQCQLYYCRAGTASINQDSVSVGSLCDTVRHSEMREMPTECGSETSTWRAPLQRQWHKMADMVWCDVCLPLMTGTYWSIWIICPFDKHGSLFWLTQCRHRRHCHHRCSAVVCTSWHYSGYHPHTSIANNTDYSLYSRPFHPLWASHSAC